MSNLSINQFRTVIIVAVLMLISLFAYLAFASFSFQMDNLHEEGRRLHQFANRSLTRIATDPEKHQRNASFIIEDENLTLSSDYSIIESLTDAAPSRGDLQAGRIYVRLERFGGIFSLSSVVLIYPVSYRNDQLYAFAAISPTRYDDDLGAVLRGSLQPAIAMIGLTISILFVVQLIQARRFHRMIHELASWADTISTGKALKDAPILESGRFNFLSQAMIGSLSKFSQLLESEHNFLRYTSHELRTQVSTISANVELLELMMKDLSAEEKGVLNRMIRSVEDMRYQSEALLWLSRDDTLDCHSDDCNLRVMIDRALDENSSLSLNQELDISVNGGNHVIKSHRTLLQIAINNLVRNALQNTATGCIDITIESSRFTISNRDKSSATGSGNPQGFGIGLLMVRRICERLNIEYSEYRSSLGWDITLTARR